VCRFSTDQQVAEGMGKLFFWAFFFGELELTSSIVGRGQRNKQISKFGKVLQQEKLDEWGNSSLKPPPSGPSRRRSSRKLKKLRTGNLSDENDNDFDGSSSETESVESGDASQVSNDEVCHNFGQIIGLILHSESGCFSPTVQVYANFWRRLKTQAFKEDSQEEATQPHSFSKCICCQSRQCICYGGLR
jgi:hypothetical protein